MFPETQDTIVAASTPSGRSLCAIIKISGPEAIQCIKDIFISTPQINFEHIPTYTSLCGHIRFPAEHVTIPVVLYIMKQPYSYTKEDVVEIHTPGSPVIVEMLLCFILSNGIHTKKSIRLSQPGEFTKRAFLHGRIDLAQAEGVLHIIRAQTDRELNRAVAQLGGDVSKKIKHIQNDIVSLCSYIEAAIDFSDQDIELISTAEIRNRIEILEKNMLQFLTQPETMKVTSEGIDTVLYGNPNVGKSSLINALLGRKRSIVCEIPGTTRDVITSTLEIEGICFKLIDTAGIDNTEDVIMSGAMEMAQASLKRAQIVVLVFDGSIDISKQVKEMELEDLTGNVIVIINKCDLQKNKQITEIPGMLKKYPLVHTSALTGEGLERLKELLTESVLGGRINLSGDSACFTVRQREAIQRSLQSIHRAMESAENNESHEFIALSLHEAIDTLGEIAGEVTTEDILDKVFSEFCIGK